MIPTRPYRSGISAKGLAVLAGIVLTLAIGLRACQGLIAPQFPAPQERIDTQWINDHSEIPDIVPAERYFLVSYSTQLKGSRYPCAGETWFSIDNGFFRKSDLDSVVYASLPKSRECYQHVIIQSIYEFKSASDFNDFTDGAQGDPTPKKKKGCCDSFSREDIGSEPPGIKHGEYHDTLPTTHPDSMEQIMREVHFDSTDEMGNIHRLFYHRDTVWRRRHTL